MWAGSRSPGRCCSGYGCGPSSSWLSGNDFKSLLVFFFKFIYFLDLTRLEASSWGSSARFLLGLDAFGFEFSDCLRGPRRLPDSRRSHKSVEMNFGNLLLVTFSAFTFASGMTPARFLVACTRNRQCCLQDRRKLAIQESKCHFNLQRFSQCQGDAYYLCAARWGGLRGGSFRLQEGSNWVKKKPFPTFNISRNASPLHY